jgi:hypothetical protein
MHVSELNSGTVINDSYCVKDGNITVGTYMVIPVAIHGDKGSDVEGLAYQAIDCLRTQLVAEIDRQIVMAKKDIETTAKKTA